MEFKILEIYKVKYTKRAKCECNCGRLFDVAYTYINTGRTKNCSKGNCHPDAKKAIGKKFGNLTIISWVSERKKYLCSCNCGGTTYATLTSLTSGLRKSCICSKKKEKPERRLPNNLAFKNKLFSQYKKGALKRNIAFDLSLEEFCTFLDKNCYYCGNLPQSKYSMKKLFLIYSGIDRIDNNQGYTLINCAPCCKLCNFSKRELSIDDWKAWLKQICKYQGWTNEQSDSLE